MNIISYCFSSFYDFLDRSTSFRLSFLSGFFKDDDVINDISVKNLQNSEYSNIEKSINDLANQYLKKSKNKPCIQAVLNRLKGRVACLLSSGKSDWEKMSYKRVKFVVDSLLKKSAQSSKIKHQPQEDYIL